MAKRLHCSTLALTLALLGFGEVPAHAQVPDQQTTPSEADPMSLARKIVNLTGDWISGKLSTPGTSVELRPAAVSSDPGAFSVRYEVHVKGAPKDQTYTLIAWPITANDPQIQTDGLSITAAGVLVCGGRSPMQCTGTKLDDPSLLAFSPVPGEIFRLELESADYKTQVYFSVVPDPIIKKSHGCSLEVIRLTPRFELALLRAKGLQPNESLGFAAKSYDEPQNFQGKADANGDYVSALLPFVKGKTKGKTAVKLKSASCTPELSFEWGK